MKFLVAVEEIKHEVITAKTLVPGDIATILDGECYVGTHILCTYTGGESGGYNFTILEDPQVLWKGWVPDFKIKLLEIGDKLTITRVG